MIVTKVRYEEWGHVLLNQVSGQMRVEFTGEYAYEDFALHEYAFKAPLILDFAITTQCNQACAYCYQADLPTWQISEKDWQYVLAECIENEIMEVALGGGEPTLHPQFPAIVKAFHEAGIVVNYSTNGTNLTDEVLRATRRHVSAVAVSHHQGRREQCLDAVVQLTNRNITTAVHYVVTNANKAEINRQLAMYATLPKVPVVLLLLKPVGGAAGWDPVTFAPEDRLIEQILEEQRYRGVSGDSCIAPWVIELSATHNVGLVANGCSAGIYSMYVGPDLLAAPCSFCPRDHADWRDLRDLGLKVAWDQWQAGRCRPLPGENCHNCHGQAHCAGACPYLDIAPDCCH